MAKRPASFSEVLRRAIDASAMPAAEVARRAAVSKGYVSHLLAGRSRPSREVVLRLALALDEDPAELLAAAGYSGEAPPPAHDPLLREIRRSPWLSVEEKRIIAGFYLHFAKRRGRPRGRHCV
jgi:transcriptional regulator with XRE-family HTH domain